MNEVFCIPFSELEAQLAACSGCHADTGARFVSSGCKVCKAIVNAARGLRGTPLALAYRADVERITALLEAAQEDAR
jgi:hypothetical protein